MKTRHAVITIITAIGLAVTLLAGQQQANSTKSKIILLKSGDKVVAKLKIFDTASAVTLSAPTATKLNVDKATGNMTAKGSLVFQFGESRNASITLKADEIQVKNEP